MKKIIYVSAIETKQRKELEDLGYTVLFSCEGTNVIEAAKVILKKKQVEELKQVKKLGDATAVQKYFEKLHKEERLRLKKRL